MIRKSFELRLKQKGMLKKVIYLDNEDVLDQAYNFAMEEYALVL